MINMAKSDRPKLLFLAYFFPPLHSVACVRTGAIARNLARIGWDVSVVTPHPALFCDTEDDDKVAAEMDALGIRRIFTSHRWRYLAPGYLKCATRGPGWFLGGVCRRVARWAKIDHYVGWNSQAFQACSNFTADDVDVILASGTPWGAYHVARRLSRKLCRPFVLDYRDMWTAGGHIDWWCTPRNRRMEAEFLSECSAVSTVSPSLATCLDEHFGVGSKTNIVSNGFDPADFEGILPTQFGHFAIVYAGNFILPKRDIGPLVLALNRLCQVCPDLDWKLHYYGNWGAYVREALTSYDLQDRAVIHGVVPRREALSAVSGAGAAVVITSVSDTATLDDMGVLTGKVFEPIGMGTPVMAIGHPGSDLEQVLENTGSGHVFKGADTEGMATYLADLVHGKRHDFRNPQAFAWPNLIARMDAMLRQVINRASRSPQSGHT